MMRRIKRLLQQILMAILAPVFKFTTGSTYAWNIFDKLKIPGFGTHLIRLYFPIYYDNAPKRNSFSSQFASLLKHRFDRNSVDYENIISGLAPFLKSTTSLSIKEKNARQPYLDNYFYGVLDASVLGFILHKYSPGQIIEIGSGISTKYFRHFQEQFSIKTQIISIDPNPRSTIDSVADRIINEPLEVILEKGILNLMSGDILFLDGSHYTFQGNDTLTFFFKILPSLPKGIIIHIHDIYLPFDYSDRVARQLWSEQYLLASMLYGGFAGYEILFPTYYMSQTNNTLVNLLNISTEPLEKEQLEKSCSLTEGYSFWFIKTE